MRLARLTFVSNTLNPLRWGCPMCHFQTISIGVAAAPRKSNASIQVVVVNVL